MSPGVDTTKPRKIYRDASIAEKYNKDGGLVPLTVMVENMRFSYKEAVAMMQNIVELMPQVLKEQDPEKWTEMLDIFKNMMRMRDVAQRYAVDAAPYMHPRLAAVEWKNGEDMLTQVRAIKRMVIDDAGPRANTAA